MLKGFIFSNNFFLFKNVKLFLLLLSINFTFFSSSSPLIVKSVFNEELSNSLFLLWADRLGTAFPDRGGALVWLGGGLRL